LNNGYDYKHWRILGVLQRFGIAYFFVGCTVLFVPKWNRQAVVHFFKRPRTERLSFTDSTSEYLGQHSSDEDMIYEGEDYNSTYGYESRKKKKNKFGINYYRIPSEDEDESNPSATPPKKAVQISTIFADITPYWIQWVVGFACLFVYLVLTFLLPVPGCPEGYLGPGGIASQGKYVGCTGGAAGYIDEQIFTNKHVYQTPTCQKTYLTGAYDPEGLLGNLTSIFLVFLGLQAGRTLITFRSHKFRVLRFLIWGIVIGSIGLLLCEAKKSDGWYPISKNLWSVPFIFSTGGMAFVLLAISYLLIDYLKIWNGGPFSFVGKNPIVIYLGHEILNSYFPFSFDPYSQTTHAIILTSNLVGVSCWCVIGYIMYRKKVFISI